MSKYRVEFKQSRLRLFLQLLSGMVLVFSVFNWQSEIIPYQLLLQVFVASIISFFVFKALLLKLTHKQASVIFSKHGQWLESNAQGQVAWKISDKSRVSTLVLFIHLICSNNSRQSKWCLVYSDQVTERDFRRLCRAVIYQQQSGEKSHM